jgi:hypothetical protein
MIHRGDSELFSAVDLFIDFLLTRKSRDAGQPGAGTDPQTSSDAVSPHRLLPQEEPAA